MDQREYYRFMGYDPAALRARYAAYADRFLPGSTVVDVGCGRGEFLELLRDRQVEGIGVDPDASMVEDVEAKGLVAVRADGLAYLEANPEGCDGIFMAHVAEHLHSDELAALIEASARALRPGGRMLLVTPNPQNLLMQLHDFWIDLQHVRYYSPHIIHWLFRSAGLVDCELGVNPLYRLGPEWAVEGLPTLRAAAAPPERGRLRKLWDRRPTSETTRRLDRLEERVDLIGRWISELYPPGEFYVMGSRPAPDPALEIPAAGA